MHQFHKVKGTYNHQKDDSFLSYERDLILKDNWAVSKKYLFPLGED